MTTEQTLDAQSAAVLSETEAFIEQYRPQPARVVKLVLKDNPGERLAKEAHKAGVYRVIHGCFAIAIPLEQRLLPNGHENPYLPKQLYAQPGSEIWLNDRDALHALQNDLVEPLDTKPSRVGKVWTGVEIDRNGKEIPSNKAWDYLTISRMRENMKSI